MLCVFGAGASACGEPEVVRPASPGRASWIEGPGLPEPRWYHQTVVAGDGTILTFGGWVSTPEGKDAWTTREAAWSDRALVVLEPGGAGWRAAPPPPGYKYIRESVAGTGEVYRDEEQRPPVLENPLATSDRVGRVFWWSAFGPIVFDSGTGSWSQPPPVTYGPGKTPFDSDAALPHYERHNAVAAGGPDGKVYLIGGMGYLTRDRHVRKLEMIASLETYDLDSNAYETKAPLSTARHSFSGAFGPDGKLYVFGGFGHTGMVSTREGESDADFEARNLELDRLARRALDSVEVYEPETDAWRSLAPLPSPVQGGAAAACPDGRIYLVGGTVSFADTTSLPDTWIFDPRTEKWVEGPPLQTGRQGHGLACTAKGLLYATGGVASPSGNRESAAGVATVEILDTTALPGVPR
jgi:hypothetical protein